MLKGIDPILGPELLAALRAMGHGDELVVADANFPAQSVARRLCRADGIDAVRMLRAVAALMPLDDFGPAAAWRMATVSPRDEPPQIVEAFAVALGEVGYLGPLEAIEREAFYDRAREAFMVIATGESRLYGNLILRKGVIRPTPGTGHAD